MYMISFSSFFPWPPLILSLLLISVLFHLYHLQGCIWIILSRQMKQCEWSWILRALRVQRWWPSTALSISTRLCACVHGTYTCMYSETCLKSKAATYMYGPKNCGLFIEVAFVCLNLYLGPGQVAA